MVIIIPTYNEKKFINRKLTNTRENYPSVKILVVDGGSIDGTKEIVEQYSLEDPNLFFIISPKRGKIPQLNFALEFIRNKLNLFNDWVMVTDTDAIIATPGLPGHYGLSITDIVGAESIPGTRYKLEQEYWRISNILRHKANKKSIVAGAYFFHLSLVYSFPEDCIADDVYLSHKANKVYYSKSFRVIDLRAANNFKEFMHYRIRRCRAWIKEILREKTDKLIFIKLIYFVALAIFIAIITYPFKKENSIYERISDKS